MTFNSSQGVLHHLLMDIVLPMQQSKLLVAMLQPPVTFHLIRPSSLGHFKLSQRVHEVSMEFMINEETVLKS